MTRSAIPAYASYSRRSTVRSRDSMLVVRHADQLAPHVLVVLAEPHRREARAELARREPVRRAGVEVCARIRLGDLPEEPAVAQVQVAVRVGVVEDGPGRDAVCAQEL